MSEKLWELGFENKKERQNEITVNKFINSLLHLTHNVFCFSRSVNNNNKTKKKVEKLLTVEITSQVIELL